MHPRLTLLPRHTSGEAWELLPPGPTDPSIGWYGGLTCNGHFVQHPLGRFRPLSLPFPAELDLTHPHHEIQLSDWKSSCSSVLSSISQLTQAKCILARSSLLHSSIAINPWSFLTQRHYPQSSLVLWTPPQQTSLPTCWAAATPELLFHRENEWIESEALAGTIPRVSDNNDELTSQRLLQSPKYRLECELVRDHIVEVFARLGMTDLYVGSLEVVSYPHLMHLRIRIRARWPQHDDQQLLKALHPTPAVCGFPRDVSSQLRRSIETRDRGWYTSAIGYSTPQCGWFAVMLRCAEILDPHTLRLWAGAGLTATSDLLMEWEELNTKLRWCTHPTKLSMLERV